MPILVTWRRGAPVRCPVGSCYLNGASLPCLPDCYHCRLARRLGVRQRRDCEIHPCPRCGHLPERIEDPGPLPRLNDGRERGCAFCGEALTDPTLKFCSDDCRNGTRREAPEPGEESVRFKGVPRELPVHRIAAMDRGRAGDFLTRRMGGIRPGDWLPGSPD